MATKRLSSDISIGARIKALRKARNLSQADLSRLLWGRNKQSRIGNWERGVHAPHSHNDLFRLAQALGVTVDAFFSKDATSIQGSSTIAVFSATEKGMKRQGNLPFFWPADITPEAFAYLVGDDLCAPRIGKGEVLLVDPGIEPAVGNYVLIKGSGPKPLIATFEKWDSRSRFFKNLPDGHLIVLEKREASRLIGTVVSRVIPAR